MFEFEIEAESSKGNARVGKFKTPHGDIQTPVFMPCGTKAAVKTLSPMEVAESGSQILLANTYHLHLRPTSEYIKERGGLHKFMNWDRPILTDSGGFQVFSLRELDFGGKNKKKIKITEDGVKFYSFLDGSTHMFTPERVMEIQANLGADIVMVFDECAPGTSSHGYAKEAMERTHRWAKRSLEAHAKFSEADKQAVFPIVQGVVYDDLRTESAKFMASLNTPGIAIGGLSVGEGSESMYRALEVVEPHLPKNKPRYLMGVGKPENLVEGVYRGVDMFDCVHATRIARHGAFWDDNGRHSIKASRFANNDDLLMSELGQISGQFTKSYIRHLIRENEILGQRLLSIHNLAYLHNLMDRIREAIREDRFEDFRKEFYAKRKFSEGNIPDLKCC